MRKSLIHFIITVFAFIFLSVFISSCHRAQLIPEGTEWKKFTYEDYNGYLYTAQYNGKVHGILCFNYIGLQGHAILEHDCTPEQYKKIPDNIINNLNATYLGDSDKPDLTDYPDLSMYLSFVISNDELHEIWANLELEEKENWMED